METIDLFASISPSNEQAELLSLDGAELRLFRAFLTRIDADKLFEELQASTQWKQERIRFYGKEMDIPRLTAWYGDPNATYVYSGKKNIPTPWTATLAALKKQVELRAGASFNSVLLNLYRNERDSVAWHSDDEPELGAAPVIASVSLGEERLFQFKSKAKPDRRHSLKLPHGSLLVMSGPTQVNWVHQVPKSKRPMRHRINLTFRWVLGASAVRSTLRADS
jgi:alkylated DNA repair dioxygenase AlkB